MRNFNITFFDLETTGLDLVNDEMVSIYAINRKLRWTIESLCKPNKVITDDLVKIHGITNEMVSDSFDNKVIAKAISNLFNESQFIAGWNIVGYDVPLLKSICKKYNVQLNIDKFYIDLKYIARRLLKDPSLTNYSLVNVYNYLFDDTFDAHRAKDDVHATMRVFNELSNLIMDDDLLQSQSLTNEIILDSDTRLIQNKHIGKTLHQVIQDDKSYVKWLIKEDKIRLDDTLIKYYDLEDNKSN